MEGFVDTSVDIEAVFHPVLSIQCSKHRKALNAEIMVFVAFTPPG